VSSTSAANGADPATLSVANFSFTNAGSTYSITSGANNTLAGTKDGQAWQTWDLLPSSSVNTDAAASSSSSVALDVLNSAENTRSAAATTQNSSIDIAA